MATQSFSTSSPFSNLYVNPTMVPSRSHRRAEPNNRLMVAKVVGVVLSIFAGLATAIATANPFIGIAVSVGGIALTFGGIGCCGSSCCEQHHRRATLFEELEEEFEFQPPVVSTRDRGHSVWDSGPPAYNAEFGPTGSVPLPVNHNENNRHAMYETPLQRQDHQIPRNDQPHVRFQDGQLPHHNNNNNNNNNNNFATDRNQRTVGVREIDENGDRHRAPGIRAKR